MKNNPYSICNNEESLSLQQNYELLQKNFLNYENISNIPNFNNRLQKFQNINLSFSERMKLKVQKTKELLERKEENQNENIIEFVGKSGRFKYSIDSPYEFSELKNKHNKRECADCINFCK